MPSDQPYHPAEVGLLAGRGRYPLLFCEQAKRLGCKKLIVVAMHGETEACIEELADEVIWTHVGQISKTAKAFTSRGISEFVCAGQIKPGRLFTGFRPDLRAAKMMASLAAKNAESIFGAVGNEFAKDGLTILPATTYLETELATPGQIGKLKPKRGSEIDINLGWRIAREVSAMDIGQTVVVKDGAVLAVEAFEGTDKAIRRGGELGKGGVTVVKVAKPDQDMRFDVPCIGTRTVESLIAAQARLLVLQAGKTLFIDKDDVLESLNKAKIAVIGKSED